MDKSKSFNIVIYPSREISQKAIKISELLKISGGIFVLDGKKYFPHITLYMMELPLKNLNKVRKILKDYASRTKSFKINSFKYRQKKDGFVDVSYKDKQIKNLQKEVISLLNPLRGGLLREREITRMKELSERQKKNVLFCGHRDVGSDFYPHLTFTKLERFDKKILSKIKKDNFSFKVNKIALFYLGEYGTCNKLIEIFDFV